MPAFSFEQAIPMIAAAKHASKMFGSVVWFTINVRVMSARLTAINRALVHRCDLLAANF